MNTSKERRETKMEEMIIREMQAAGASIAELLAFAGVDPEELGEDE
jgi:hypothetical protein